MYLSLSKNILKLFLKKKNNLDNYDNIDKSDNDNDRVLTPKGKNIYIY